MSGTARTVPVGGPDIDAAARRISGYVRVTPLMTVEEAAFATPVPLHLKLELLQHAGSFKPRGAFNRIVSAGVPAAGVIAASGGNHGLAVAYAARTLGVRAEIFVPEAVSAVKVAGLRRLGAAVSVTGAYYADALEASRERAVATGALVVHAYDDEAVVAGQATVGRELLAQVPGVDTILVAVGGGGLLGGVVAAVAGRARVVAVEPEACPCLHDALAAGRPVDAPVSGVAADSLGARRVGGHGFGLAVAAGVRSVLVSDETIMTARRRLWERLRVAAEPGGATALAAVISRAYVPEPDERVAVVVCGGNTDPSDLAHTPIDPARHHPSEAL